MIQKIKGINLTIFLIIFFIGVYLRFYQINFEDYWFDEYSSFWVADPKISFSETLRRSYDINYSNNLFFDLILKYFVKFFGYEPSVGRYLPFVFGVLSIPPIVYLSYQLDKDRSYLFTAFLVSINWYLISYSQETRCYSLAFFLAVINLIFFFKIFENHSNKNYWFINSILFILFTFLGLTNHIFFFIIVLSQIIFLIIQFKFYKKNILFIFINIFLAIFLYFLFMHKSLLIQLSIKNFWITQVEPEFFLSYFFPRFFGSKIMGYIYLLTLVYLIFKNKHKFFYGSNKHLLLLIILFMSYFLPLFYGFIFRPILIDRYIIFVLIPIILLISTCTWSLENKKIKKIVLLIIISFTLGNNYIEIFNRKNSKPEFNKALNHLSISDVDYIYIKAPKRTKELLTNYIQTTKSFKKNNFIIVNRDEAITKNNLWQICYQPINNFDCSLDNNVKNFTLIEKVNFHLVEVILYSSNV